MNISESKNGNVTIVALEGKLDSISSPELEARLVSVVENGSRQITVDLAGLDYISSAGLRVFLSTAKRLQNAKGKLALANPSAQVQQIFDIAGFASVLSIFKNVDEAVQACAL